MPNFPPLPGAPYGVKDPFPSPDANAVSEALEKSHNADEGSSHAPTGDSAWSGSMGFGWTFADAFPFSGDLDVTGGITFDTATSGPIVFGTLVDVRVYGTLRIKTPLGGIVLETGAIATMNAGSTTNLNGATNVRGVMTIEKTGGPGSVEVEDTCTLNLQVGAIMTVRTNAATVEALGKISWKSTAVLEGLAGASGQWAGTWSFTGAVTFSGASGLTVQAGATVAIAADVAISGAVTLTGNTTFGASKFPLLDPARPWNRRVAGIAATSYDGATTFAKPGFLVATGAPIVNLASALTAAGQKLIMLLEPPPDGSTIASVTVDLIGPDPGGVVDELPTYRILRWQNGIDAAPENMSNTTNDAHSGTAANWQTSVETTITVNALATIDSTYQYGVLMTAPRISGVTVAAFVTAVAVGTTDRITGK